MPKPLNGARSFSLLNAKPRKPSTKSDGNYRGQTPEKAADHAARQVFRSLDAAGKNDTKSVEVTVRETTRGSLKKEYSYRVTRSLKAKPETKKFGSKTIIAKWDYGIVSLN